ncbi:MAG: hypothetical protein R6W90_11715 [Ignavibacteriaceae bacterium]
MKLKPIIIILLILPAAIFAQENSDSLKSINQKFQAFEYEEVIFEADSLLNFKDSISINLLLDIYRMKGISHFTLLQDRLAEHSFIEIIKIDTAYTLDSAKTSPKIISFYNEIRNEYIKQQEELQKLEARVDTVYISDPSEKINIEEQIKGTVIRSIILPGWGHLYSEQSAKGIILTSLSAVTILSSVYFIFDTNSKEDEYVNTRNPSLIPGKWDDYNSSYKMRNYSLIAFAAVWVYSQLDLLLFSNQENIEAPDAELTFNSTSGLNFNWRFAF